MGEKIKKKELIYFFVWMAFTAVLFIWSHFLLRTDSVTFDSSYQYFLNLHGWKEMFALILIDYSPPLYSILLKSYSTLFGTGLVSLRIFSTALLSLNFLFALFPLRRLMGDACALVASVLFLTSSYNIYFGLETRPTLLAYVLTTGMIIYSLLSFFGDKRSDTVLFTILALMSMYTHYVSLVTAFCVYGTGVIVSLLIRKKDVTRKFLISGITVAVLYVPWLLVLLSQFGSASDNYWKFQNSLFYGLSIALFGSVSNNLFQPVELLTLMLIIFLPLIDLILMIDKSKLRSARRVTEIIGIPQIREKCPHIVRLVYLLLSLLLSVTAFYLITRFVLPIFTERYFYIYTGGAIVFIAGLATLCKGKKIPALILCALVSVTFVCNSIHLSRVMKLRNEIEVDEKIDSLSSGNPAFLHFHEHGLELMGYNFPESRHFISDDTYTVMNTLDVFGVDLCYIGDVDEVWDYTDEVYIFCEYNLMFTENPDPAEYYKSFFDDREGLEIEIVDDYVPAYCVAYMTDYNYVLRATKAG